MSFHASSDHICLLPFPWSAFFFLSPSVFFQKLEHCPCPCCPLPYTCWFGFWGFLPIFPAEDPPKWKFLLKGTWFSLPVGPVGHLRLQVDLYAKHGVSYPALPSLREGWDEAPRALPWALTAPAPLPGCFQNLTLLSDCWVFERDPQLFICLPLYFFGFPVSRLLSFPFPMYLSYWTFSFSFSFFPSFIVSEQSKNLLELDCV